METIIANDYERKWIIKSAAMLRRKLVLGMEREEKGGHEEVYAFPD